MTRLAPLLPLLVVLCAGSGMAASAPTQHFTLDARDPYATDVLFTLKLTAKPGTLATDPAYKIRGTVRCFPTPLTVCGGKRARVTGSMDVDGFMFITASFKRGRFACDIGTGGAEDGVRSAFVDCHSAQTDSGQTDITLTQRTH